MPTSTLNDSPHRLRWQCRRGLLELDILLGRFLETHYDTLSDEKKSAFRALLQYPDQELLYWFTHQTPPPDELKDIVVAVVS